MRFDRQLRLPARNSLRRERPVNEQRCAPFADISAPEPYLWSAGGGDVRAVGSAKSGGVSITPSVGGLSRPAGVAAGALDIVSTALGTGVRPSDAVGLASPGSSGAALRPSSRNRRRSLLIGSGVIVGGGASGSKSSLAIGRRGAGAGSRDTGPSGPPPDSRHMRSGESGTIGGAGAHLA